MSKIELEKKFSQANLPVKIFNDIKKSGLCVRDESIFQMSIRKENGLEKFILYMGIGNRVEITDVDNRERQMILELLEPEREFKQRRWTGKGYEDVINKTSPELRKFLVGHDEVSLFICELPSSNSKTVEEAHLELKPKRVNKLKRANIKRQGEWFFVPINKNELKIVKRGKIMNNERIEGSGGKPHIAREIVKIKNTSVGKLTTKVEVTHQFVRGIITHPDHFPLTLKNWHRVYRNTEIQRKGVYGQIINGWVD